MLRGIRNKINISKIPVVLLTASADVSSKISGIEKGADGYLLIPFNDIGLQEVLRNLTGSGHQLRKNNLSVTLSEIPESTNPGSDDPFLKNILSLMDSNLDDDQFGIAEICDALGMSRARIYRKFKSLTDKTPHDYLRGYRLQKARELLLTTRFNISEIAYRTGFKNVSHFSRIFTKEFTKSPSEFGRI